MALIAMWHVLEFALESGRNYDNPFADVAITAYFAAPSGEERAVEAFWDGGRTWRVRFSPDEVGEWKWRTACSDPGNRGLHGQRGGFRCVPYEGKEPLYRYGTPRLSEDRFYFEHADGTPFFWLSDTAWNGVLRAQEEDWGQYLQARRKQEFTAIQFVCTQWRGCSKDPYGETAFTAGERLQLNPRFFQRLDAKVKAINEHGLVAAPVILWAFREGDPGCSLSEEDAAHIARYIVARWGAYQVIWFLGGDGHYDGEKAERWKRIGRAVFGDRHDRLVTMHPCGRSWVAQEFRDEGWFDFIGYQSGHGASPNALKWLIEGPPARDWRQSPPRPVINLEPNYEAHPSYEKGVPFSDREVRRAACWSLLVSSTAGVSYGHNAIWVWAEEPQIAEGHEKLGTVRPWREALTAPGGASMATLHRFFASLPWWRLRPAPELLAQQPGKDDPRRFVAAAKTEENTHAVLYLPVGGRIELKLDPLKTISRARWFNPRTGEWSDAGPVAPAALSIAAPDENDWLLCFD